MAKTTSTTRTRLLGMALLAATFAAGGLAGAAFERVAVARPADEAAAREVRCENGEKKGLIVDQVNPTPEQRARIDAIMERRRVQMDAFWDGEGQRLRAIVDSTRAEVRQVLTPEQAVEYDRLVAEKRARREAEKAAERRGSGAPPAGAPARP